MLSVETRLVIPALACLAAKPRWPGVPASSIHQTTAGGRGRAAQASGPLVELYICLHRGGASYPLPPSSSVSQGRCSSPARGLQRCPFQPALHKPERGLGSI